MCPSSIVRSIESFAMRGPNLFVIPRSSSFIPLTFPSTWSDIPQVRLMAWRREPHRRQPARLRLSLRGVLRFDRQLHPT